MPLLKRLRVMAAKAETTIGTDASLDAAAGAFNAYDVMIQPAIEVEEREGQGSFDYLIGVPGAREGTATFKTDCYVGAGQPAWASVLLPGCGFVGSSGAYTPRSEAPGTNVKTLTIGVFENGLKKFITGATGTFKLVCPSGKMAYIEWEFKGVWQPPVDAAMIAPTYPTDKPLRFANATCTFDSESLQCESVTLDAGNEMVMREDPSEEAGFVSSIITNRYPKITASPESVLVATKDRFNDWIACNEAAFALTLNGPSSSSMVVAAPKAQVINNQESDRNRLQVDDIEWSCNRNGAALDQQVTITITPES